MKKNVKNSILLGLTLMALSAAPAFGADIKVTVGDKSVVFTDAAPFVDQNSRTLVPLRAIADELGLEVAWDDATKTATFTKITTENEKKTTKTLAFKLDSAAMVETTAVEGGEKATNTVTMDTAAVIKDSRVYAPIRYLAEGFSNEVGWDEATSTVTVKAKVVEGTTETPKTDENTTPEIPKTDDKTTEAPKTGEENKDTVAFTTGKFTDRTYKNEWLDLEVTFPEDMKIATEEEIKALVNTGVDIVVDEETADQVKEVVDKQISYGFIVIGSNMVDNYQLLFEDVSKVEGAEAITEDEYLNVASEQVTTLGFKDVKKGEAKIAGKTYKYIECTNLEGKVSMRMNILKAEDKFVCINVSYLTSNKDAALKLLDNFTTIQK